MEMTIEQDMLFGAIALQEFEYLAGKWDEVVSKWGENPSVRLADLLVDRGWINHEQRRTVWAILESRKDLNTDAESQDTRSSSTEVASHSPSYPTQLWQSGDMNGASQELNLEGVNRFEALPGI